MDDERNKMLFKILKDNCEWKDKFEVGGHNVLVCRASSLSCKQKLCMPFKFALFLNKPGVMGRSI
jgi:hypothetical protein